MFAVKNKTETLRRQLLLRTAVDKLEGQPDKIISLSSLLCTKL